VSNLEPSFGSSLCGASLFTTPCAIGCGVAAGWQYVGRCVNAAHDAFVYRFCAACVRRLLEATKAAVRSILLEELLSTQPPACHPQWSPSCLDLAQASIPATALG
jgi:hypothetical protein